MSEREHSNRSIYSSLADARANARAQLDQLLETVAADRVVLGSRASAGLLTPGRARDLAEAEDDPAPDEQLRTRGLPLYGRKAKTGGRRQRIELAARAELPRDRSAVLLTELEDGRVEVVCRCWREMP